VVLWISEEFNQMARADTEMVIVGGRGRVTIAREEEL
jgi:hypothetical protein